MRSIELRISQDGEQWIAILDFPLLPDPELQQSSYGIPWDLIGTEDGFVAVSHHPDQGVVAWHSADGFDWRELGPLPGAGTMSRSNGGAIVVGDESVWYISGAGIVETPLPTTAGGVDYGTSISVGGVGTVIVDNTGETANGHQILYSSDGQTWIDTDVPPEMLAALANREGLFCEACTELAAMETAVLMRVAVASNGAFATEFAWFLGTPITSGNNGG